MVFRLIIYDAVAFFLGFSLGNLLAPGMVSVLKFPQQTTPILMCAGIFAVIFTVISHFVMKHVMKPVISAEDNAPSAQQQWAWLKPAGIVVRSPYPINKEQIFIGRDIKCDIMLRNDSVSRRHAEVIRDADSWLIRDLESSNGTFVNGQRVKEAVLNEGDVITLGDINLTFEGPRRPIPTIVPEAVSQLVIPTDVDIIGEDTAVHNIDPVTATLAWQPRSDMPVPPMPPMPPPMQPSIGEDTVLQARPEDPNDPLKNL